MTYDDPRAPVTLAPDEEGLPVSCYRRSGDVSPPSPTPRPGILSEGCPVTPLPNGLSRIEKIEAERCDLSRDHTRYGPTEAVAGFGYIDLSCDDVPLVIACRLDGTLPNDWEARVTLPKDLIDDWGLTLVAARDFFEAHLHDCGGQR